VLDRSRAHRETILELPYPAEVGERFVHLAAQSIEDQRKLEASDTLSFEAYRQKYLSPQALVV